MPRVSVSLQRDELFHLSESGADLSLHSLALSVEHSGFFQALSLLLTQKPSSRQKIFCIVFSGICLHLRASLKRSPDSGEFLQDPLLNPLLLGIGRKLLTEAVNKKAEDTEFLIEGSLPEHCTFLGDRPFKDLRDPVESAVFAVQLVIGRKSSRDLRILQVLYAEPLIHRNAHLLVDLDDPGEVLPASGCHELPAVDLCFDTVKVFLPDLKIGQDRPVDPHLVRVLLPHREVFLDIDPLYAVQRNDVEIPHGLIVLGRISGCDDDKTVRDLVVSEHFVLQKLQHSRRQCLRDTVDLVQKQDSL